MNNKPIEARLAYLRGEIEAERISWHELAELQGYGARYVELSALRVPTGDTGGYWEGYTWEGSEIELHEYETLNSVMGGDLLLLQWAEVPESTNG